MMVWLKRLKILFCIQVFFVLCNAIVSNEDISTSMSPKDRKSTSGTEDDLSPDCEIAEFVRPLRSKRSGRKSVNVINVVTGMQIMTLNIVGDEELISRTKTGIWAAQFSSFSYQNVFYDPWPQVFDYIENFQFLQNVEQGSALTRFWDSHGEEHIIGIVKHNYTVRSISRPLEYEYINIHRQRLGKKRSVDSMNNQDNKRSLLKICKNPAVPQQFSHRNIFEKSDVHPEENLQRPKRQITNDTEVPDVVYPKFLIIPHHGIIERSGSVRAFLMQLIAQLNCVDMMFRQLKNPEVRLNIAGIIMPWDNEATPYMSNHIDAHNRIDGEAAVKEANKNFQKELRRFPHNDWQSILMLTTFPIAYYTGNEDQEMQEVNSLSLLSQECSGTAGIVRFSENMMGVVTLAHEIGHMLGATHDLRQCQGNNTSYLMQTVYDNAAKLEWSNCSQAAFRAHFRSDERNCTYSRLRKIPNEINTMRGAWLTPAGQCDNFYDDSTDACINLDPPHCFIFRCKRNGTCDIKDHPPMEGTILFDANRSQACVNWTMVSV